MRKLLFAALLIPALFIPVIGAAAGFTPHQLTLQEKHFDFTQLLNQINNQYGPRLYKEANLGIDIGKLALEYWDRMSKTETNGEFYSLIVQFVAEFHDGHFGAKIPTKFKAFLPVDLTIVEDKVVIENIDRKKLSEQAFPFNRGDEVTQMDGRPVMEVIAELEKYLGDGNPRGAKESAAYYLTLRHGKTFPVPEGKASLTIKPAGSDSASTVELDWVVSGQPFDENDLTPWQAMAFTAGGNPAETPESVEDRRADNPMDLSSFDLTPENRLNADWSYNCNGKTRIAIPEGATILNEEPFTAYYHPTPKGNIGYLRIAHYSPSDDKYKDQDWFDKYHSVLETLEKNTVGLIIDQDHNCGGTVTLMEDIVSLFMSEKFKPLQFQFRASKMELLGWEDYIAKFDENVPRYDELLDIYTTIMDSISQGLYLTPMSSFRGNHMVEPLSVYTKPIIVLADFVSGSCGDGFPAMMQGLGRAKILGSKTGGLGGNVDDMEPLFYSQIKTRMTQSLFFHPNGTAIENNGVTPDIPYEITYNDFMNEYRGYQQFYLNELMKLLP